MRPFLALLAVPVLLAATACSSDEGGSSDAAGPGPAASSSAAPGLPDQSNAAGTDICEQVVAGINAFNEGDYDETVARFEDALPLAEAADDGSEAAESLLAAVRYYAALDPDDYLEASQSSPEFERWKTVTLGQCVEGSDTSDPGSDGPGVET
jgi:hypothetical protein